MIKETHRRIFLSITAGIVAAGAVALALQRERRRFEEQYDMTTVLRARRYLPAGETLDPDRLRVERIPTAFVEPRAIRSLTELTDATGHAFFRLRTGVMKGSQLTRTAVMEAGGGSGLAWTLPAGQTAVSIRLSQEAAVAGFIEPGDTADVFWRPSSRTTNADAVVRLLLPLARVIAVQDRAWHRPASVPENNAKPIAEEGIYVTLMVTPSDAARLLLAAEHGSLHLALASPLEVGPPAVEALRMPQLNRGE